MTVPLASGVGLAVLYALCAWIGLTIQFPTISAGILWLPLGLLLGWLHRAPARQWPMLVAWALIGQWLAESPHRYSFRLAAEMFLVDAAQVLMGALILRRWAPPQLLQTIRGVLVLIGAAVVPAFLFAFAKVALRLLTGTETQPWDAWWCFLSSNVLSILVMVPPVLGARRPAALPWPPTVVRRVSEALLLVAGLAASSALMFLRVPNRLMEFGATAVAPLPFVVWAAVRFGAIGASSSVLAIALIDGWRGTGPLLVGTPVENLLATQMFLIALLVSMLLLGAALRERERALERAGDSEARYRSVVDHQIDMICRYLPDTTLTFVNDAYCRFVGRPAVELLGTRWIDRLPAAEHDAVRAMIDRLCTDSQRREAVHDISIDSGEFSSTHWINVVVADDRGQVRELQGIGRDVTDLARTNEALRRSQQRLKAAVAAANLGDWEIDLAAGTVWWSDLLVDVTGRSPSEFQTLATAIETIIAVEDLEAVNAQFAGIASGQDHRFRFRIRRPDGEIRWLEGSGGALSDGQGRPRWLVGFAVDITQRVADEETLRRALEDVEQLKDKLAADNAVLLEELSARGRFGDLVFASRAMRQVLARADRVAPTDSAVLITGETGTGKELLARAIHVRSRRRDRPLVSVNCAALPAALIESELFGHEKGAFTGAATRRAGRFEVADGGTLFLDEVGELPLEAQAKLLRVLQNGEFERVGSSKTMSVDVRVIAATNRALARAVREGAFREDLFYRLNVFPIHVPPLRERVDDIAPIAAHILDRVSRRLGRRFEGIGAETLTALRRYPWPGNARELENVLERAAVLTSGAVLTLPDAWDVPAASHSAAATGDTSSELDAVTKTVRSDATLETLERVHILQVLERTHWRVEGPRGAAVILGINPSTLRSRMARLGIRAS